MMKASKSIAVLLMTAAVILVCAKCYCDDSAQDLKVFRGQVMDVDWVGSLITVTGQDDMTFYVPSEAIIVYGTERVSLSVLEQGDDVMVIYSDDPAGTHKVVSITVNKSFLDF